MAFYKMESQRLAAQPKKLDAPKEECSPAQGRDLKNLHSHQGELQQVPTGDDSDKGVPSQGKASLH